MWAEGEGCVMTRLPDVKGQGPQRLRSLRLDAGGHVARAEARLRTCLRTGWISDLARKSKIECLFMDISPHGARLRLSLQASLPARVLVFDDRSQATFTAEVRWHRSNEVGLFIRDGTVALRSQ